MATDNGNSKTGAQTNGNSTAGGFDDVPMMRMPFGMVMLSKDQENNGRVYEGTVGIKYGATKDDWLRMSYIEMKKLIDFCMENKAMFNTQLKQEREKLASGDL